MKPFHEELTSLLAEREMSGRELARLSRRKTGWGSSGTVALYLQGELPPTLEGMEAISKALNVSPSRFTAYRMAALRRDLNPEYVGWPKALRTLKRIEAS